MSRLLRSVLTFLVGCTIFVGLPVLAWGLDDVSGLFSDRARQGFFAFVLVLNAIAAFRIPEIGKKRPAPKFTVGRQHAAVVLLQVLSLSLVVVGPFCDRRNLAVIDAFEVLRFAGVALYGSGFLMMHLAEAQLAEQFSLEVAIQEGHRLVTAGLYRYVRHPRYLGILLFSFGIALVFRSWLAVAAAVATTAVLAWRIRDEERLMRQEFGAEWTNYVRPTWRLVPFVY